MPCAQECSQDGPAAIHVSRNRLGCSSGVLLLRLPVLVGAASLLKSSVQFSAREFHVGSNDARHCARSSIRAPSFHAACMRRPSSGALAQLRWTEPGWGTSVGTCRVFWRAAVFGLMVLVAHMGWVCAGQWPCYDLDAALQVQPQPQGMAPDESRKTKAHVVGPGAAARACFMPPAQDESAERPAKEKARCLSALLLDCTRDASGQLRPAPRSVDNGAAAWAPIGSLGGVLA